MRSFRKRYSRLAAMSLLISAATSVNVFGGATLSGSSTATWTFDPDTSGGTQVKVINASAPPTSASMPAPPTYQLNQTFTSGSSSSTAKGSIGYVANATTATFTLAAGTGVTQSDPGNAAYPGASKLRVDFEGVFNATSPGFGPPATGYVSISVGGVVGTGGSAQFTGQVNFLNSSNVQLRPTVNFDQTFSTAGSFAKTFTSSALMNPSLLPTGTAFRVKGFFEFRASNEEAPSSMSPLDIDFGGAPPTATWYSNGNGSWHNSANWTAPDGSFIEDLGIFDGETFIPTIPGVPNGAGQRARFANFIDANTEIDLDDNVTLGALDTAGMTFKTNNGSKFVLNSGGDGNASITARNKNGNKTITIDTEIDLESSLDVMPEGNHTPGGSETDQVAGVKFKKKISGVGKGLNILGDGLTSLDAANTFTGDTVVEGGELEANVASALGMGNARAKGGKLKYNAAHAAAPGKSVKADEGGEIELGIVPESNEKFVVGNLGAISGNANQLAALDNSATGNLQLDAGAIVGHATWDIGPKGSPKNLGTAAKYTFGVSSDFVNPDLSYIISVGSDSKTTWNGFGSGIGDRVFGATPQTSNAQIQVKGTADLVSLGGTLFINGRLQSSGNSAVVNKVGKGAVALENVKNEFQGNINVKQGTLLVDGELRKLKGMSVFSDAALGGAGRIDGPVSVANGGVLSPGSNRPAARVATLTTGALSFSPTSILSFDLGEPGTVGAGVNDLVKVEGNLLLDGTLNIADTGGLSPGLYTLFQYTGSLNNQGIAIGSVPGGGLDFAVSLFGKSVLLNVTTGAPELITTAVPEPSTGLLAVAAAGSMMLKRRRNVR
jgi:autotransporter-associated beta strand protein